MKTESNIEILEMKCTVTDMKKNSLFPLFCTKEIIILFTFEHSCPIAIIVKQFLNLFFHLFNYLLNPKFTFCSVNSGSEYVF